MKSIQGAEIHTGKRPKGYVTPATDRVMKNFTEAERLTIRLHEAIEKEEFEEAARLRDLIKQMKEEKSNA
jgi:protein arginine kinase activator